jgi:2-keto-4-pentenoate hydratase
MTIMDANAQRDLARLLATLRREGQEQSGLEARLVPADKDTAYRIARMVEEELGWQVVGWKIAAAKEEMQKQLRTDSPIYGRVFAPGLKPSPASVEHARQLSPIPEVEYMARLGVDLPPRAKAYTVEEVTEAVTSLHPGIELAECRFVHDDRFPPLPAILADGAGSGTVCYGPAIADWKKRDIAGQEVTLSCNGVVRRKGTAAAALDHPMVPLTWLANELSRTGIGMKAGQMISTGTLTGMLRPKAGETYVADFGPFGQVSASYR